MTVITQSMMLLVDVVRCDGRIIAPSGADMGRCGFDTRAFTAQGGLGELVMETGWLELREVGGVTPVLHFCGWDHMNEHVMRQHAIRYPPQVVEITSDVQPAPIDEPLTITIQTSAPPVSGGI